MKEYITKRDFGNERIATRSAMQVVDPLKMAYKIHDEYNPFKYNI